MLNFFLAGEVTNLAVFFLNQVKSDGVENREEIRRNTDFGEQFRLFLLTTKYWVLTTLPPHFF